MTADDKTFDTNFKNYSVEDDCDDKNKIGNKLNILTRFPGLPF